MSGPLDRVNSPNKCISDKPLRGEVRASAVSASILCQISKFNDPKIRSKKVTIRLDSGADVTVVPKHIADFLRLNIDTGVSESLNLVDASGNRMIVCGESWLFLTPTHGSLKGRACCDCKK